MNKISISVSFSMEIKCLNLLTESMVLPDYVLECVPDNICPYVM